MLDSKEILKIRSFWQQEETKNTVAAEHVSCLLAHIAHLERALEYACDKWQREGNDECPAIPGQMCPAGDSLCGTVCRKAQIYCATRAALGATDKPVEKSTS